MTPAASSSGGPVVTSLEDAVARNVQPGDTVLVMMGHSRWTAAARELARQFWGTDPGFTLVMTSLGALGAVFFRGGLVRKVVTAYSGNSFPTYTPNPVFRQAYESGDGRGRALVDPHAVPAPGGGCPRPARGRDRIAGRVVHGRQRRRSPSSTLRSARSVCSSPWRPTSRWCTPPPPTRPATSSSPSRCSTACGAPGRPVGASWRPWSGSSTTSRASGTGSVSRPPRPRRRGGAVRRPSGWVLRPRPARAQLRRGHRALERGRRRRGQGRVRLATSRSGCSARRRTTSTSPASGRSSSCGSRVAPIRCRGRPTPTPHPIVEDPAVTPWEQAASLGAREVERVVADVGADAVLAGAGVANLAAWVAVARARAAGRSVMLTAELGLWGYQPTPADPYIFNQRVFPATPYLSDASAVLGMVIGGPGTTTVGCLGAAEVDRDGSPELDRAGRRALPGGLGRRQRRGQPGHGVRRRHPGPARSGCPRRSPTSRRRGNGW